MNPYSNLALERQLIMPPTLDECMILWEEARRKGASLSPEELCADCPELLSAVKEQIDSVVKMESILGIAQDAPHKTMPVTSPSDVLIEEPLPHIPGYRILRMLDRGGMGVVYEAIQLSLSRTVALKMISGVRASPKAIARFRTEAEAAAELHHPHIVQIFEVGQAQGQSWFSMEYVRGGSLADRIGKEPFAAGEAAQMVETLAHAVQVAHERGIVHRDLKPANVLLTENGSPKIADFGLAKRLDADEGHTHTGEVLGTPSYMAPEQAQGRGDQIGPLTDVYALGTILYEMLSGQPPYQGSNAIETLRMVTDSEPVSLSRRMKAVPRDLEAICLKCLEKSPSARYGSARDLAEDLSRFRQGRPIRARRIGPGRRALKWVKRHPQWAVAFFSLAVVVLIPLILYLQEKSKERGIKERAIAVAPLVREILHRNCYECHGEDPSLMEKNLDILNHQQLLDSDRKIVMPGSPADSRLIQRIADGSMPPEEEETRLPRVTEKELAILQDWILGGAPPLPRPDPDHPTPPVVPWSDLAREVWDIFELHCYECHKYDVAKGGIKILHHRLLVTVRKVVVPGKPEESELFSLITSDKKERMPPPPEERLSAEEIATIRKWIEEGALPFPRQD